MAFDNYEVLLEALPSQEDITYHSHPVALRTKQLVVASLFLALLAIAPIVFIFVGLTEGIILGLGLWLIIALSTYITIYKSFPLRGYALRQQDLTYRKGWIFQRRTTVPFNRIQHSEINQGPLDRKYNISSLKIFTAGGSSSDLLIPGLPPDEAQRIHEFITDKTAQDV